MNSCKAVIIARGVLYFLNFDCFASSRGVLDFMNFVLLHRCLD